MDPFRRLAFFILARDTGFIALAAATLMVGFSFMPWLAFGIGANVALLYAIVLMVRARRLTDERITRVEAWKLLRDTEDGAPDPLRARDTLRDLLLRFARTAAAAAVVLSASSLIVRGPTSTAPIAAAQPAHAAVTVSTPERHSLYAPLGRN
jgi:hypothetical protein